MREAYTVGLGEPWVVGLRGAWSVDLGLREAWAVGLGLGEAWLGVYWFCDRKRPC
jgi:hypothetical protein